MYKNYILGINRDDIIKMYQNQDQINQFEKLFERSVGNRSYSNPFGSCLEVPYKFESLTDRRDVFSMTKRKSFRE